MSKYFFVISLILFLTFLIALFLTPESAPNFLWIIIILLLVLSFVFLISGIISIIIFKIRKKQLPTQKFEELKSSNNSNNLPKENFYFKMEAKEKFLIYTNIGTVIGGLLLLYFLLLIRGLFNLFTFFIGILILIFYIIFDYINWHKKGIRIIEIDENGINLYIGKEKKLSRIRLDQITNIDFFSKVGRRIVNIMLGGKALKLIPGITLFSGQRIRITDDCFKDTDFDKFVEVLMKIKGSRL